jgi:ribosomal protein L10
VIKNTIIRKTTADTLFAPIVDAAKNESMYIFIPEGASIETYRKLQKWFTDIKIPRLERSLKAVVIQNTIAYGKDIAPLLNLPTKNELLLKLMMMLRSVGERFVMTLKSIAASKDGPEENSNTANTTIILESLVSSKDGSEPSSTIANTTLTT